MTKNITGEEVSAILERMPDELDTDELSAFILTLTSAYLNDHPREAVNMLLTSTILYAKSCGLPDKAIAAIFEASAEHVKTKGINLVRTH